MTDRNAIASAGVTLALAAVLAGCGARPDGDELFPLRAGHVWTYRVSTRLGNDAVERETLTLRTLGHEALPALDTAGAWHRRSDTGLDYWLRADASGIYRVASKTDLQAEPVLDKAPRFVLKAPYTVGTQWQAGTTTYLLMRHNEFPREIRHTHPNIAMNYQIDAVGDVVDVPAGRFDRCLRVKGVATVRVYADPASGWRDLPLTTTEWYCPGVGLVKLERSEPVQSAFLIGGSRTLELEHWQ